MGLETALFGTVVGAAGPIAPTAGLLGVGGKFTLGTAMGSLTTGLSIFSGLSSVAGGMASQREAGYQSELALQQAESRAIEQERQTFREARLEEERADQARRRQKVAYLASGVTLDGSPLDIMEETRRKGAENVEEIRRSGEASANSVRQEGRLQAAQLKSSGRQAFVEGLSTGSRSIMGGLLRYA